ncbi:hypothetical protein A2U01_0087380, partial [Trifolium medium]|nr:hypothetical protein [Trifolium medium]
WRAWLRTAPIPVPEASVSKVKGIAKSGRESTGASVIACLRLLKASVAS